MNLTNKQIFNCEKKIYFQDQKDLWDFDILMVFLKTRLRQEKRFLK